MKTEVSINGSIGALSPPATLSPPSSPPSQPMYVHSPWSPSGATIITPQQDRFSAFNLVPGYNADLQRLPARGESSNTLYTQQTLNAVHTSLFAKFEKGEKNT